MTKIMKSGAYAGRIAALGSKGKKHKTMPGLAFEKKTGMKKQKTLKHKAAHFPEPKGSAPLMHMGGPAASRGRATSHGSDSRDTGTNRTSRKGNNFGKNTGTLEDVRQYKGSSTAKTSAGKLAGKFGNRARGKSVVKRFAAAM